MRPILQRPSGRSRLSHGLRSYCTQGRKQATRAQKLEPIRNCIPVRKHIGTRGLSSWRFPVNSTSGLHDKSTAWHPLSLSLDLQTNPKRLGQTYLPHEQATDLGTLDCFMLELLVRAIPLPKADFVLKPLLMPILAGAFLLGNPKHGQRILVTAALFFSWLGDVFLLFEGYFVFGLASFLVAHIIYVVIFQKERGTLLLRRPWIVLPFLLLTFVFYWFARNGLGSMTVPVLGYITVICMMALAAINRYGTATQQSFQWTVAGALFFRSPIPSL